MRGIKELSFSKEDCEYTKFNIENHKIEFDSSGDNGILILFHLWMIHHKLLKIN